MECSAQGEGSTFLYGLSAAATAEAQQRAQVQAEAQLQRQMASARRAVQCPRCGVIPPNAVLQARTFRLLPCIVIAVVLLFLVGGGQFSPEMTPIVIGIAVLLVVLGACLAALYRPRREPAPAPRNLEALAAALSRGQGVQISVFEAILTASAGGSDVAPSPTTSPAGQSDEASGTSSAPPPTAIDASRGKSKRAVGGLIVISLIAVVIGYAVYSQRSAAAARAEAAFAHAESRFADAQAALTRQELEVSVNAYRDALKTDARIGDRQHHGKTFAEMSRQWDATYRGRIAESSPQLIEAAIADRIPLSLTDHTFGEFAPDAQQQLRTALKERFDAVATDRARTPGGRSDMDALLGEMRDAALSARWQPLRRQPLLERAARTYIIEFRHMLPDEKGKLVPLDASSKVFESESEQQARQIGDATTRPSRERESAWNALREPLEDIIREAILGQANGDKLELHRPGQGELAELGDAALAGAARGRIQVTVAWGFQGFRARGHDYSGRIQYRDKYVPHELLVGTLINTARGQSTWDGRHIAEAKASWSLEDENTPTYSRDRKVTPEKQLQSQVRLALQQDIPPYKHTNP